MIDAIEFWFNIDIATSRQYITDFRNNGSGSDDVEQTFCNFCGEWI